MSKTRFVRLTDPDDVSVIVVQVDAIGVALEFDGSTRIESKYTGDELVLVKESPTEILRAIAEAEGAQALPEMPSRRMLAAAIEELRATADSNEQHGDEPSPLVLRAVADWLERVAGER